MDIYIGFNIDIITFGLPLYSLYEYGAFRRYGDGLGNGDISNYWNPDGVGDSLGLDGDSGLNWDSITSKRNDIYITEKELICVYR